MVTIDKAGHRQEFKKYQRCGHHVTFCENYIREHPCWYYQCRWSCVAECYLMKEMQGRNGCKKGFGYSSKEADSKFFKV